MHKEKEVGEGGRGRDRERGRETDRQTQKETERRKETEREIQTEIEGGEGMHPQPGGSREAVQHSLHHGGLLGLQYVVSQHPGHGHLNGELDTPHTGCPSGSHQQQQEGDNPTHNERQSHKGKQSIMQRETIQDMWEYYVVYFSSCDVASSSGKEP